MSISCSICVELLTSSLSALPCGHVFHTACISQWIKIKPNCPLCKAHHSLSTLIQVKYEPQELVNRYANKLAREAAINKANGLSSSSASSALANNPFLLRTRLYHLNSLHSDLLLQKETAEKQLASSIIGANESETELHHTQQEELQLEDEVNNQLKELEPKWKQLEKLIFDYSLLKKRADSRA